MAFDSEENAIFFVRFAFSFVYAIVFSCARAEASKVRVRVIPPPVLSTVMSDIIIPSKVGLPFTCLILKA